jgi:iron complex transport system substrate-binding protein
MRIWLPLLLCLSSCSAQPAILPGKIVSNNPCVDAILSEIADPAQIGAVSAWSHDAASATAPVGWARQFPAIGAEAEAVIASQPKLALIGAFGRTDALDRAGVQYLAFGVPANLADSAEQVRMLAKHIDRTREGERLALAIEAAGATTLSQTVSQKSAIIWLSGGFVPGEGTLQDELLARAGYRNASKTYGLKQWDVLPIETLILNPPDVIFTPATGKGDDRRSLAMRHRLLARLAERTHIVAFPEKLLNCGGPSIIATMKVLRS